MRKALSKRTRFNVFKRDCFACAYCGRTPPGVVLECDHVVPVVQGGGDEEWNLVTACMDCNRGKAGVSLDVHPVSLGDRAKLLEEQEAQIAAYRELLRAREDRIEGETWDVVQLLFGKEETTNERYQSIRRFLGLLPFGEICEAAAIASAKQHNAVTRFKYFCGICWRKIERSRS